MSYLGEYLRHRLILARAGLYLLGGNAELKAAECMFHLNREARGNGRASTTYQVKNHLVRIFCKRGLCIQTEKQEQTLECYHTLAYNRGQIRYCPKCGNTGVYARHLLYKFTFNVSGKIFIWHQPERLVDWPVTLTGETEVYEVDRVRDVDLYDFDMFQFYQAVMLVYLRWWAGVPRKDLPKLQDFRKMVKYTWLEFVLWWRKKHGEYDDIPF